MEGDKVKVPHDFGLGSEIDEEEIRIWSLA